ncbi:tRNA threonylcarbamoyladenosine biosynthesis protein TsaE [Aliiroseovarius halocynthiae]|uniref:tRNA threonylcarbamoyladenosine biosynthesis protein TsaE n=1 Tax=Aliiroseovarius halocynthiae TaxID=985055 RepID=A0A545SNK3_9RHOB|nr:tRNA (adenosine(37)-N6)-threonylcarbamoyltransferase complex ATPase subunit type 1 TsaE [Aliiroseovarius halocynthiae]TQV66563.1 tRNA (adenosine(37)-N6)-threonylcarbamoyltransferase complex ATPase subunit type 1 TsaE [Aliiroseovarius halocynthiae]SMR82569.1 tRNA threonylcarbamoyladenosine biosynthesis protein TsaE [Aliiroseovarius halocynthiae]
MTHSFHLDLAFPTPDHTTAFAAALADQLAPGDVILLSGGIGAGKTHFARSVIQHRLAAQGRAEDVPSPTFTLVQTYDDPVCEIWHSDLYRLTHPDEVEELGLIDAFDTAICLVEWPDRLGALTPQNAVHIEFSADAASDNPDLRNAQISGQADRWETRIQKALQ